MALPSIESSTPKKFFLKLLLPLLLSFAFSAISPPVSEARLSRALPDIIDKVHERQAGWTFLRADLTLRFESPEGGGASCEGKLLYERLEEKILLECRDPEGRLQFIFKTADRNFEVYLPKSEEVYRGTIFDLKDSPKIESYLEPLDLYRALKLGTIPLEGAKVARWSETKATIEIDRQGEEGGGLARKLEVDETGLVGLETFYNREELPETLIRRSAFREVQQVGVGRERVIMFPFSIEIENPPAPNETHPQKTILIFHQINFPALLNEKEWASAWPATAKIVDLTQ